MELHLIDDAAAPPKGAIFVWAPPSHGNVGQIAIDAIVSKCRNQCEYVGCIESKSVMPISGYCDITGSKLLCKPIEVYRFRRNGLSADDSVYFVQQRAPCLRGQSKKFCGDLADLLYGSAVGCALLVVASGASTASMLDEAVQGSRIFAMSSHSDISLAPTAVADHVNKAVRMTPSPVGKLQFAAVDSGAMAAGAFDNMYDVDRVDKPSEDRPTYPHGMLLARRFFETTTTLDIGSGGRRQVVCIGRYCNEGAGNVVDGQVIADSLVQMLLLL